MKATLLSQRDEGQEGWRLRVACASFLVVAVFFAVAPAPGSAEFPYPDVNPVFTGRLDELSLSTNQAGANPDLTLKVSKRLWEAEPDPDPPPYYRWAYTDQSLKRITLALPPGLVADANAAPYCDLRREQLTTTFHSDWQTQLLYFCGNPDSQVGSLLTWFCSLVPSAEFGIWTAGCYRPIWGGWSGPLGGPGTVFNERPRPGEQGHLVVLWPTQPTKLAPNGSPIAPVKMDVSVRVRPPQLRVTSVSDDIPDVVAETGVAFGEPITWNVGGQIVKLEFTLDGAKGAARGHPLLSNPTYCDPLELRTELQGYERQSVDPPSVFPGHPTDSEIVRAEGDGQIVTPAPVPFQAEGCEQVPYDPKLTIDLDTTQSQAVPAISSVVSQGQDEATTGRVDVAFPRNFKINDKNTATHCAPELLEATRNDPEGKDHCPDSSKIGTVTASSPLLPIAPDGEQQKLKGNVYLAGLTGDSVKVSTFLHGSYDAEKGFIDFDLEIGAEGSIGADLVPRFTFSNLPAVPVSRFELEIEGGQKKGLLKNPAICKAQPEEITADFISHSGKVKRNAAQVRTTGCGTPTLEAELSNPRKAKLTDLDLSLSSRGNPIAQAEFGLDRHLHWGLHKGTAGKAARRKTLLASSGTLSLTTADGIREGAVSARRAQGGISFAPISPRAQDGRIIASALGAFSANLVRTRARQQDLTSRGTDRRTGKRRSLQSDLLLLGGLPENDLTGIDLTVKGEGARRALKLKNPLGCKRPLNFVARGTFTSGERFAVAKTVRLKGKGCGSEKR